MIIFDPMAVFEFLLVIRLMIFYLLFSQSVVNQEVKDLVWNDEFNNTGSPDTTKWGYDLGDGCPDICGWGNRELEYYTRRPENVRVENGNLIIEAIKENRKGRNFTSAKLVTKNKGDWQYGRIEVRAKLPTGKGTWPAIWMLPTINERQSKWPADGEIDIMEQVGYDPFMIHGTVHTNAYNHVNNTQKGGDIEVIDAVSDFHIYKIEWSADKIEWYVDDSMYFTFKNEIKGNDEWPFDRQFHLILNIAVGGTWGGSRGVDPDIWPQKLEIDYVRVYQ